MSHRHTLIGLLAGAVSCGGSATETAPTADSGENVRKDASTPENPGAASDGSRPADTDGGSPDATVSVPDEPDDFAGPFDSWDDLQKTYGAKGDGVSDDTAAFQAAMDQIGQSGHSPVVFLPQGTYRITSTLHFNNRLGVSFIGEDPANTIVRWDGNADGPMAYVDGVFASTVERMTWDGAGKVDVGIKFHRTGQQQISGSRIEHIDMVYRDMTGMCVQVGENPPGINDELHQFIRNKFIHCGEGIGLRSWNSLLHLVVDSEFIENDTAIRVHPGSVNAYRNVFRGSKVVDIDLWSAHDGIRNNVSIGSNRFLSGIGAPIALQKNTIVDPKTSPVIEISGWGLTMVDNVVTAATDGTSPILQHDYGYGGPGTDVIVGNTFTMDKAWTLAPAAATHVYDNQTTTRSAIATPNTDLPPTPKKTTRPILEVSTDASGQDIQQAIDKALHDYAGRRPIVHIPWGAHQISSTLDIPAGADVELLGDDAGISNNLGTSLAWSGAATDEPIIKLHGPTKARLTRLTLDGKGYTSSGVVVTDADQPGGQVIMNRAGARVLGHALWVNGLKRTNVDVYISELSSTDGFDSSQTSDKSALRVDGAGPDTSARVVAYSSDECPSRATGDAPDVPSIEVFNQGRVLIVDGWNEVGTRKIFVDDKQSGTMVFWNYLFSTHDMSALGTRPWVEADSFHGLLTLLGAHMVALDRPILVGSEAPDTDVLALQTGSWATSPTFERDSTGGKVSFVAGANSSGTVFADTGDPLTKERLLAHLALPRSVVPSRPTSTAPGVTDLRIHRLSILGTKTGVELRAGE